MQEHSFDVAVVGSGFAGSLTAILLAKRGLRVLMLEKSKHPRFAIGESSTPLGNFKLFQIAQKHDLRWLEPFAKYGTWKRHRPDVSCGPKRGFAYFSHNAGATFSTTEDHSHEWMVTASSGLNVADTHWFRSDVDFEFVRQAEAAGVAIWDQSTLIDSVEGNELSFRVQRGDKRYTVHAKFIVIATGNPSVWEQAFRIPLSGQSALTETRSVFAHFQGVTPWADIIRTFEIQRQEHPFPCDQSALHHVFDGGWMWQLRFDNGVTSAGFTLDVNRYPANDQLSANDEWSEWLRRFPSIAEQFRNATMVDPDAGIRRINRLQQPYRSIAGSHWACLPSAIGFADPLFSTGIAHGLYCVDRLVDALDDLSDETAITKGLAEYSRTTNQEIALIDRFVALAYRASNRFDNYVAATLPYFIAATTCEARSRQTVDNVHTTFLLADDREFLDMLSRLESSFETVASQNPLSWQDLVHREIHAWDRVGLTDAPIPRMITRSAAD